jgi:hypothetical protein
LLLGVSFERMKEAWNFMATVLTSTVLVPMWVALFVPRRAVPLAGTLSSWGGLGAVAVFFLVLRLWGEPYPGLESRRLVVAGVEVLHEYALFFTLPVSALGYLVGAAVGRRR